MVLILLLASLGCIPPRVPVQTQQPTDVAMVLTLADVAKTTSAEIPESVTHTLIRRLSTHNLRTAVIAPPAVFANHRSTNARILWLLEDQEQAPIVMLVEVTTRSYGQLSGLYRWIVDVDTTLVSRADPDAHVTRHVTVPVHLQHIHHGAREALDAATPVVLRHVDRLLDAHLPGLTPTSVQ